MNNTAFRLDALESPHGQVLSNPGQSGIGRAESATHSNYLENETSKQGVPAG